LLACRRGVDHGWNGTVADVWFASWRIAAQVHRARAYEEFSFEPGDLRALVALINAELVRCTEPVDASIRSLRKALRHKVH
jgi:hypothetical protein